MVRRSSLIFLPFQDGIDGRMHPFLLVVLAETTRTAEEEVLGLRVHHPP